MTCIVLKVPLNPNQPCVAKLSYDNYDSVIVVMVIIIVSESDTYNWHHP